MTTRFFAHFGYHIDALIAAALADSAARKAVERACLLTKSREWAYEHEWRMLAPIGMRESPRIMSIIFGLRCPLALQYVVVRSLERIAPRVIYWEMRSFGKLFSLRRTRVDVDQLLHSYPLVSSSDFSNLDAETMTDSPSPSTS